jgi:hypothetical protein
MKFLRSRKVLVAGFAAVLLLPLTMIHCGGEDPVSEPEPEREQLVAKTVVAQDDGSILGLFFVQTGSSNENEDPLIMIKNTLDRNIVIDFDGTNHYEVSLGDHKETKKSFPEGWYKIMVSAGSFKFVPNKDKVEIEREHEYSLILRRIPIGTEYNFK